MTLTHPHRGQELRPNDNELVKGKQGPFIGTACMVDQSTLNPQAHTDVPIPRPAAWPVVYISISM